MTEHVVLCVEVLNDDRLFVLIAVPPLVAHLEVGIRILFSIIAALTCAGFTVAPYVRRVRITVIKRFKFPLLRFRVIFALQELLVLHVVPRR